MRLGGCGWRVVALVGISLLSSASVEAGGRQPTPPRRVVITVDDLPWVEFALSTPAEVAARHRKLIDALSRQRSQAIGFVNEDKLYQHDALVPARRQMLEDWLRAGLSLGNHTYGHRGLHSTAIADYEQAILRGESELRPLMAAYGAAPVWFRHPFLQAGQEAAARQRLADFLARRGYRIAPVTIDNGDWIFARAYVQALNAGDQVLATSLRDRFIAYIEAKFKYYEQQSKRLFGREIPQILLLHASALNADSMDELLRRLRRRGYEFVSMEDVIDDPAYAHADGYRGRAGISWMHRWAMAEQQPKVFYQGEPAVPADVLALAGVSGE
jgi:peptidoglycan/xylan/chitin deacetylase (PgdA/CDA1 family)